MSQRFPEEVHDFIRNNVAGRTAQELADMTNAAFGTNFTASSMKSYKANHKLRSGTPCGLPKGRATEMYPAEVAAYIQANYKGTSYADMATQLKEVFGRDYTPAQIMGYYKNHKLNSGLTGRFEKGDIPPNKGRKGYVAPGSEKGWFQKGSTPWDTVPVGTIVTKTDGYLWKKIDDKPGVWLQNWKQLHLLIWEEAHGRLPGDLQRQEPAELRPGEPGPGEPGGKRSYEQLRAALRERGPHRDRHPDREDQDRRRKTKETEDAP